MHDCNRYRQFGLSKRGAPCRHTSCDPYVQVGDVDPETAAEVKPGRNRVFINLRVLPSNGAPSELEARKLTKPWARQTESIERLWKPRILRRTDRRTLIPSWPKTVQPSND